MGVNQRAQIVMSATEIADLLATERTMTIATIGVSGRPHLVAMWFAVVDGEIWFETKAKSQKVVNLRRDPRITVLVESGVDYDELRGVSIEGTAEVIDDREVMWPVGVAIFEKHYEPYTEEARPIVDAMIRNRVVVRVRAERTRSWDHRKLRTPVPE